MVHLSELIEIVVLFHEFQIQQLIPQFATKFFLIHLESL